MRHSVDVVSPDPGEIYRARRGALPGAPLSGRAPARRERGLLAQPPINFPSVSHRKTLSRDDLKISTRSNRRSKSYVQKPRWGRNVIMPSEGPVQYGTFRPGAAGFAGGRNAALRN